MKGLSARSFFFLAVLLFNVEKSAADPGDLLQTFLQPNPAVDDRFGWSVAWVDGHVFVGTPFDDTWETNAGAVYMFDVDGTLLQNFPSPNPAVSGLFGNSVAVMGDRFLVGANYDNGGTGAAYLFNVDGTLLQTFLSPNPGGANQFGNSVALTGNQVLVGAHQDLFGGTIRTGAAYLFDTDGTFLQKLQKPVPAVGDLFGLSVDLADGLALVGAYGDDTGAPNAGAAYLFGTDGTLLQTFLSPTPVADNHFGRSVALVDGLILVGAQGDNIGGAAYLFDTDGNLLHTFQKPTPAAYDAFGYSVAGEGDRVLIGAIGIGAVYLFGLDGTLLQTFLNPTPAGSEYFGSPVVFADGQVLVAAPREDSEATDAGAVYLFEGISADPVAVSLPEMTATYNQNILVPVSLSNVPSSGIVSAEVFLSYDSSLLTVNGVQTTGALSEGWSIQTNIIPGTGDMKILKIAAATNNLDIVTDGTLFDIDFTMADIRSPASSPLILEHVLLNDGDPENTTTDGSVTLVGVGGTIANDPTEIIPREDIIVIVTDIDEDRDILMKDSFDVRISNGAQSETLTVLESAVSSGIFEGAISTVFSLGSTSGDGKVQAQAGDVIQSCYDDWLDTAGNTIERCDDTNVIGGTDGAIRVTIVSQPGDTVRVRVTDADLNVDPDTPQSAQVTATNPTTGESETVNLNEDGDNSDVFFGLLFTAPGSTAGAPDDATLNTAKGDVLDITYTDVVTEQGGTEDLVDDDEVVDPFGDADGNGSVQAFDAAKVLLHALTPYLTGLDSLSANVDSLAFHPVHGKITPFDASLVLQKRVGLIGRFPIQEDEADNHPQPETDDSTPKMITDERLLSLQTHDGYVSVWANDRSAIVSGELVVKGISGAVEMGEGLDDFLSASREIEEGLRIVFAGASSVKGPGELLRLYPGVGPGNVRLTRARFNDGRIVSRITGTERSDIIPQTFVLHPNMPNPFNPETMIRFELPYRIPARLEVFDALGQRVVTLVSGVLPAGVHEVMWDGHDQAGTPVSSGLYLYRLRAGGWRSDVSNSANFRFEQVHRMLLIK